MIADRWLHSFFDTAVISASLSKDPKAHVGAVIVDNRNRIISSGFNGLPSGIDHNVVLTEDRDTRLACTIHAEANALAFAWQDVQGMMMVCTRHPCAGCAAMIVQRGISRVCYLVGNDTVNADWQRSFDLAQEMFTQASVTVEEYEVESWRSSAGGGTYCYRLRRSMGTSPMGWRTIHES